LILSYPVIASGQHAHRDSFVNLLGETAPEEMFEKVSLEKQVNKNTPPTFIWHTYNDTCVPVENSLLFAGAMKQIGIPFELHIFDQGVHGLSVCTKESGQNAKLIDSHVGEWVELCIQWLNRLLR